MLLNVGDDLTWIYTFTFDTISNPNPNIRKKNVMERWESPSGRLDPLKKFEKERGKCISRVDKREKEEEN